MITLSKEIALMNPKLKELGCVLPWFSSNNQCFGNYTNPTASAYFLDQFRLQVLENIEWFKSIKAEDNCKKP